MFQWLVNGKQVEELALSCASSHLGVDGVVSLEELNDVFRLTTSMCSSWSLPLSASQLLAGETVAKKSFAFDAQWETPLWSTSLPSLLSAFSVMRK